MFLRLLFATLFILVFSTCDLVSPNRPSYDNFAILDTVIDYNKVDVYPLLAACTNCDTSLKQNQCFEIEFVKSLEKIVNKSKIEVEKKVNDTVFVDILVDYTGRFSILKIYRSEELLKNIPNFENILQQSMAQLPAAIQPSLKRGIPVNVKFKLPVVVSVKE